MKEILLGILAGMISGIITALLGYAKSVGEEFDPKAALQTVIVGGFVGGVAGFYGITYTESQDWLASTGGLTLFEYVKKAIWRRISRE